MVAERAEVRALRIPALPAGAALFGLWAVGAIVIVALRPGQLLEFATIGVMGTLAWRSLLRGLGPSDLVVGATCFLLPLLNTWPLRIYQSVPERFATPLPAVFAASSIAAMVLVVAVPPARWRALPALAVLAGLCLAVGGAVATALSANPWPAFASLWSEIAVPLRTVFPTSARRG